MQNYEEFLNEIGYKHQIHDFIFESKDNFVYVTKEDNGYHEIAICPRKYFDRWAISRHIKFTLMVENWNGEYGWTKERVKENFLNNMADAELLCKLIPARMFEEKSIRITLM